MRKKSSKNKDVSKDKGQSEIHKLFDYDPKKYTDKAKKVADSLIKHFPFWQTIFDDECRLSKKTHNELLNLFCCHLLKYPFTLKSTIGVSRLDIPPSKIFEKLTDKSIESALQTTNLIVQLSNCFSEELKFMFATEFAANWRRSHGSKGNEITFTDIEKFQRDAKDLSIPINYIGTYISKYSNNDNDVSGPGLNRYRDEILKILTLLPLEKIYKASKNKAIHNNSHIRTDLESPFKAYGSHGLINMWGVHLLADFLYEKTRKSNPRSTRKIYESIALFISELFQIRYVGCKISFTEQVIRKRLRNGIKVAPDGFPHPAEFKI